MEVTEILEKIPDEMMDKLRKSGLSDEEIAQRIMALDKGDE